MKIIVVNKYFHPDGGAERYMFGFSDYVNSHGHEAIPFAMAYSKNVESKYSSYFVPVAGDGTATKFREMDGGVGSKLKIAARSVYSKEAKENLRRLIKDTKPDIVYCLNIVNHISPSVIDAARECGVPVVMRLSDYYLTCPNYLYLRDGAVCTECDGGYYKALKHRCVFNSLSATFCRVAGMYAHKFLGVYGKVGGFVCTTEFMRNILIRQGFGEDRVHRIVTFVNAANWEPRYDNDGYILYFGRLFPEKGIEYLLDAYMQSGCSEELILAGTGATDYVDTLKARASRATSGKITFVGKKLGTELQNLVRGAKYVVVPSVWYDNAPNVVYESFAAGKPVIAFASGGLCEQVTPETGILVEPKNTAELSAAMSRLSSSPEDVEHLGRNARQMVEQEYNVERHVEKVIGLFNQVIEQQRR